MNERIDSLNCLGEAVITAREEDRVEAEGRIPQDLELFQDHFPAFPVLPGVLTVDILKKVVEHVTDAQSWKLEGITRVKFSSYLRPGGAWRSELRLKKKEADSMIWQGKLFDSDKAAAAAQLTYKRMK